MLHKTVWIIALFIFACSCTPPIERSEIAVHSTPSPQASSTISPEPVEQTAYEPQSTHTPPVSAEPPAIPTAVDTAIPRGNPVVISAADPRIRYVGRFDFSDPQEVYFDWSGVAIEASFSGPSLTILLKDGNNLYNISIDEQSEILETFPDEESYLLAQDLADGPHVVRITKRTEAYIGGGAFSGFIVAAEHDLLEKPATAERQIEFVGDSITTGYGNEGETPNCWFTAGTQNVAQTYAALTADQFNADYSIVALSGLGVVRNLSAAETSSPVTAIDFVDRAVAMNPIVTWDPEQTVPDAVVVNLGTNDFSSLPFPDIDVFADAYVDLLQQIRERYPRANIFALSGPLMLDPAPSAIRKAVDRMRAQSNDELVHYVGIENILDESGADFGCDWHPNVQGHKKISDQLVPVMADTLGW